MNFEFTEEQEMIRQAARDFAKKLEADVIERDTKAEYPTAHVKEMSELGFMGMMVPPEYGGGGMDTVSYVLAIEEIAKVDSSLAVIMSVNNSLVCYGIEKFGTEGQKQKYLPDLAAGAKIGAFLLSEPEAGSDATHQNTLAEHKDGYWLLNGMKNWISTAHNAGLYVVFAQTNSEKV